ncbi:hypothetical protein BaRGS_00006361 [Batillaria attramentaria]|uniref:Uncharacterized protein n=1 Tax=Batillaria attramentaria TaxID=370345 RepID=A0ABD0LTA8_9CAEN
MTQLEHCALKLDSHAGITALSPAIFLPSSSQSQNADRSGSRKRCAPHPEQPVDPAVPSARRSPNCLRIKTLQCEGERVGRPPDEGWSSSLCLSRLQQLGVNSFQRAPARLMRYDSSRVEALIQSFCYRSNSPFSCDC